MAIKPQDQGRAGKRTEHERQAAIGTQMRRGFIPAAGLVEVGDAVFTEDTQGCPVLGRNVHSPFGSSGSDKKYTLLLNKVVMICFNTLELLGHGYNTFPLKAIF